MVVLAESAAGLRWRGRHELVRTEPWDRSGLGVRGSLWQAIGDDLPGALRDPPPTSAAARPPAYPARIPSGALIAKIPASSGRGSRMPDHASGRRITAPAPLDTIPVLFRKPAASGLPARWPARVAARRLPAAVGMAPGQRSRGRFSCQPADRIRCPRLGWQPSKEERR